MGKLAQELITKKLGLNEAKTFDQILDQASKISDTTSDLPSFTHALLQNIKEFQAKDVSGKAIVVRQAETVKQKAKELDEAMGGLIISLQHLNED